MVSAPLMIEPEDWQRVYDDGFAKFGRKSIQFASPDGDYAIEVDEMNQDYIVYRKAAVEQSWWIVMKEVSGEIFRLSGPSYSPDAWYQLTLTIPAKIVYWPNETIRAIHHEVSPSA